MNENPDISGVPYCQQADINSSSSVFKTVSVDRDIPAPQPRYHTPIAESSDKPAGTSVTIVKTATSHATSSSNAHRVPPASGPDAGKQAEILGKEKEHKRKQPTPASSNGEEMSEAASTPNVTKEPKAAPRISKQTGKRGWSALKQASKAALKDGSPSQPSSKAKVKSNPKEFPAKPIEKSAIQANPDTVPASANSIMKRKAVDPPEAAETLKKKQRSDLERQLFPSSPLAVEEWLTTKRKEADPTASNGVSTHTLKALQRTQGDVAAVGQDVAKTARKGAPEIQTNKPNPNHFPSPTAARESPSHKEAERIIVDRLMAAGEMLYCVKYKDTPYQE